MPENKAAWGNERVGQALRMEAATSTTGSEPVSLAMSSHAEWALLIMSDSLAGWMLSLAIMDRK